MRSYEKEKKEIEKSLPQARSLIHYTMNLWTSPNHIALLGIVAHFADSNGCLNRILLALQEIEGVHSGENQCRTSDGHDQIMIEFCSTMICSISLNHRVPRSQS